MALLVVLGIGLLLMSSFAQWVASQKGRSAGEGFVLGLLFGPLGVLVEALLPARKPTRIRRNRFKAKAEVGVVCVAECHTAMIARHAVPGRAANAGPSTVPVK